MGEKTRGAVIAAVPWYATKKTPAFSDMLAAVRRESWRTRVLDRAHSERSIRKSIAPLLRAVGYGWVEVAHAALLAAAQLAHLCAAVGPCTTKAFG